MGEVPLLSRKLTLSLLDGHQVEQHAPRNLFDVARYRASSLIRNNRTLGPYSRLMPRALWWS